MGFNSGFKGLIALERLYASVNIMDTKK